MILKGQECLLTRDLILTSTLRVDGCRYITTACYGIYLNGTIIIHLLSFAFWYIYIYFMKASLWFLMDNQICIEHHYSPYYVSYVNYFYLPYYDYG